MNSKAKNTPAGVLPSWRPFLKDVFGDRARDVWVTGFHGDPGAPDAAWHGGKATDMFKTSAMKADADGVLPNIYFVPYLFSDGAQRNAQNFESAWLIPVDDVGCQADVDAEKTRYSLEKEALAKWKRGGKVGPAPAVIKPRVKIGREGLLQMFGPPTLAIVTSQHGAIRNEQWFYKLDDPCTDGAKVAALAVAIGSDAKGLTRYVRMPGGANHKPAHGPGGFVSVLGETGYDPTRVFDIDEMIAAAKADVAAEAAKLAVMNDPNAPAKPEFLALQAAGLLLDKCSGTGLERAWTMLCPGTAHGETDGGWIGSDEGHTPGLSDEAKVWENGGFQCHHSHCSERNFNDLCMWVRRHPEASIKLREITSQAFTEIEDESSDGTDDPDTSPPASPKATKPLPIIRVSPGTQALQVDKAIAALAQRGDFYQRGGTLCMIKRTPVRKSRPRRHRLSITQFDVAGLRPVLSEVAVWGRDKMDKRGNMTFVPCDVPDKIAQALLSANADLSALPPLDGTISTPFMVADGSVAQANGAAHYDGPSELYIDPDGVQYPEVLDSECTKADAKRELEKLTTLLRGFPFDGPLSKAVAVAGLMMPFVRPAVDLVPCIAIDAPSKGSGKTKLASLPGILARGVAPSLLTPKRDKGEELDKAFNTAQLRGETMIVLDNIEGDRWGTPTICGSITGHTVAVRIYGKTTDVEIPNTSCLFVTGNNLTIPGDMTRRVLVCRIDPKMERPETRDFDFDVEEEAKRDRPALVHAILTILRAYVLAGRPAQHGRPLGSFGQFSRMVRDALMWLGLPDVALSTDAASLATTANPDLAAVLTAWDDLEFGLGIVHTAGDLADAANKTNAAGVPENPELLAALASVCPKGITAGSVGYWLRANKGMYAAGVCAELVGHDRRGSALWQLRRAADPVRDAFANVPIPDTPDAAPVFAAGHVF